MRKIVYIFEQLVPWLLVLFGGGLEPLGDGALLEEECHSGQVWKFISVVA